MKYVSLFAGIGGFDLALNRLGHECVYANDFDKYCKITYDKNFSHKLDTTSITGVPAESIPQHDLLVGGFPCQSFSIAGKRGGFDDTRGTLFFDIARIIKHHKTKYLILENVKGLLSHDNGRTFRVIIKALTELGYDLQWQVLNSKNFGVPQNRERIYIVGHLRGLPRPQIFPLTESTTNDIREITSGLPQTQRVYAKDGISPTLDVAAGGNRQPKVVENPVVPTIRATQHKSGDNQTLIAHTVRSGGRGSPHGSKQNWDSYEFNGRIRRLTPIECERLQGFPDNWTQGVSDTQRYKQLGNAVTVNVVKAVASRLPNPLDNT